MMNVQGGNLSSEPIFVCRRHPTRTSRMRQGTGRTKVEGGSGAGLSGDGPIDGTQACGECHGPQPAGRGRKGSKATSGTAHAEAHKAILGTGSQRMPRRRAPIREQWGRQWPQDLI
jgi:hypothetical protein